jgi:ABC-2 type transport system ATP-binding protein
MADRVGVINKGQLILAEEKTELMKKLGKKQLTLTLTRPLERIPAALESFQLQLGADGTELAYTFDSSEESTGVPLFLRRVGDLGLAFVDIATKKSSLEDIFVSLVHGQA